MILRDDDGRGIGSARIADKELKALSEDRIAILRMMAREPVYPAKVARDMGIPIQSAYYHIRILENAGLVRLVDHQERNGGIAKRYSAKSESLSIILREDAWKPISSESKSPAPILRPFIPDGGFDGLMVVGSPDPHGKYRARATEIGALELAMLIGRHSAPVFPLYVLDTQIRQEDRGRNLILAGGPKVNTLVAELNGALPVRFSSGFGEVYSASTKKRFGGNIGVIALIANPDNRASSILVVGGINHHGTRAAVLSLVRDADSIRVDEGGAHSVVEGFDEDGDGRVDSFERLE